MEQLGDFILDASGTITQMLNLVKAGDVHARDRLFDRVYSDLKQMAAGMLAARSFRGDWLGSTALVSAACERVLTKHKLMAEDRRHFFFVFSRAMKDVLVEQARSDLAAKRGGGRRRVALDDCPADGETRSVGILDVHEALEELTQTDSEAADAVMLRFFGGCTLEEVAELTGCTFATARRNWEYARAWLHERLSDHPFETESNSI